MLFEQPFMASCQSQPNPKYNVKKLDGHRMLLPPKALILVEPWSNALLYLSSWNFWCGASDGQMESAS
jgi:hypothetical protein